MVLLVTRRLHEFCIHGRDQGQLRRPWRCSLRALMLRTASALERGVWEGEVLRRPIECGIREALELSEEREVFQ